MNGDIVLIKGDGVGQEIVNQAIKSLKSIERKYSHKFYLNEYLMGESAYNVYKKTLPDDTLAACKKCKNILFGVVGSPTLDLDEEKKPVKALFGLRKELDLFTDLRPIRIDKRLSHQALLKEEYIQNGVDILVVRELTAGRYFGEHIIEGEGQDRYATDLMYYNFKQIDRIVSRAFQIARNRKKKVTLVDKANVLATSKLWRLIFNDYAEKNPDITVEKMYIDTATMQLIRRAEEFDVILSENMFGDIISDEAGILSGFVGMIPYASIGEKNCMCGPTHGSANDIAGKNIVNPMASILSASMMLRYGFGLEKEASDIDEAVYSVLADGYRAGQQNKLSNTSLKYVGTDVIGDLVAAKILSNN